MLLSFLKEYLHHPATTGALAPSSAHLARRMAAQIDFDRARCLVEYGPGTGVFTDVLIRQRRPGTVVVAIEANPAFCRLLRARYSGVPHVHIIHGSAGRAGECLRQLGLPAADYVVSGLPFASLPRQVSRQILGTTRRLLRPGGKLVLFQYTTRKKELFDECFTLCRQSRVLLNFPPAFVLTYAARQEAEATA